MMSPKKRKFRKEHKGRIKGVATSGTSLAFGSYGLKATTPERITARQIEAARRTITRAMKRQGRLWIRIFTDIPVTKKPLGVRMGSGKGPVDHYICRVKPGKVIFELDGVPRELAEKAFELAAAKLPIKTRFIARDQG